MGDALPANFAYEREGQKISAKLLFTKGANYDLRGSSGSPETGPSGVRDLPKYARASPPFLRCFW